MGPFTSAASVTLFFHEVREPCKKGLNRVHHALQSPLGTDSKDNKPFPKTAGKGSSHLQSRRTVFFENISAFKERGQERLNSTTITLSKVWKNRRASLQELNHNLKDCWGPSPPPSPFQNRLNTYWIIHEGNVKNNKWQNTSKILF